MEEKKQIIEKTINILYGETNLLDKHVYHENELKNLIELVIEKWNESEYSDENNEWFTTVN